MPDLSPVGLIWGHCDVSSLKEQSAFCPSAGDRVFLMFFLCGLWFCAVFLVEVRVCDVVVFFFLFFLCSVVWILRA